MRLFFVFVFSVIAIAYASAQSYTVSFGLNVHDQNYCDGVTCRQDLTTVSLRLQNGTSVNFPYWIGSVTGSFTFNSLAVGVEVSGYSNTYPEGGYPEDPTTSCPQTEYFPIAPYDCAVDGFYWSGCIDGSIFFSIYPIISLSGPSTTTYCAGSTFTLTASSGFGGYDWYYKTESIGWTIYETTTSNTSSVSMSKLPGVRYNENIYFKGTTAGCDATAAPNNESGPYKFLPSPVTATYNHVKPMCSGGSDGSVYVTSYSRSPLAGETFLFEVHTDQSINPATLKDHNAIAAGNYYALARSTYGNCGAETYTPVSVAAGPRNGVSAGGSVSSSYNGAHVSCNGGSNAQITASGSGGNGGPYMYKLDGGSYQSSTVFTGVSVGGHTITVKDGCSIENSGSTTVTVVNPSIINIASVTPTLCNGTNGNITVAASGGTGALEYSSNNGSSYQSGNVLTVASGSSYPVRVKDINGCSVPGGSVIVRAPLVSGTPAATHPGCAGAGASTGNIILSSASGGSGSYTYSVGGSYQAVGVGFNGLSPGGYTVTVSDGSCFASGGTVTINQPIGASYTQTPESCTGKGDGSITITSPGGGSGGGYTYGVDASSFGGSATFTSLSSATGHTIKIRDGNGCEFNGAATVALRPAITPALAQTGTILCNGQTTAGLNLTPGTGWSGLGYSWKKDNVAMGVNTQNLINVGAGTYEVTITDDKTCSLTKSLTITQPSAITGTLVPTLNGNGFAIACKGSSTGSINLTPSGGTGPTYTYLWYKNDVAQSITSEDLSSVGTGNYKVKIRDVNGCEVTTANQFLNEPTNAVSVGGTKTDVSCFGSGNGSITLNGVSGFGALQYKLNSGSYQSSAGFIGLGPATYIPKTIDGNGCEATGTAIVIGSPVAALSITGIIKTNPTCNGSTNGTITTTASGGTGPYQYTKDDLSGSPVFHSGTIPGLPSGSYVVKAVDAKGCNVSSATQTLTDPALITFNTLVTQPQSCGSVVDGQITTTASGGTGTIQYSLNGTTFQGTGTFTGLTASGYTVTARDANSCIRTTSATVGTAPAVGGTITQTAFINCNGQNTGALSVSGSGGTGPYNYTWSTTTTGSAVSNLGAGLYDVTINDSKGCSASRSFTVNQPGVLNASLTKSDYHGYGVSCAGSTNGFVNVIVNGGTTPYSYSWTNGVLIKDISGLSAGIYSLTVEDNKGCIATGSVMLVSPTGVTLGVSKSDVLCNGGNTGSVSLSGGGGSGSYEYALNGGAWQSSGVFSGLTSLSYTVSTRDNNGCVSNGSVTIGQPQAVSVTVQDIVNTTCGNTNGSAGVSVSGGTGSYTYSWRNSALQPIGTTPSVSGLSSGSYTIEVKDQHLCLGSGTAVISASNGAQFDVTGIVGTRCWNSSDGSASVSNLSGVGPYTVSWPDGSHSTSISNLLAGGSNTVSVEDGNHCTTHKAFTVPSPSPIVINETITAPTCSGTSTASIAVIIGGGSGGYTYYWNNGTGSTTQNTLNTIPAGSYIIKVTDANICESRETIEITDLAPVTVAVVSENSPGCANSSDGIITVAGQGGNGGYTYEWTGGSTAAQLSGVGAGLYRVTTRDVKGCEGKLDIELVAPGLVTGSAQVEAPQCNGDNNGIITITGAGGVGTFTFTINGGAQWQSGSFTGLGAGNYTIGIKDGNGCQATQAVNVSDPDVVSVTIGSIVHTRCNESNGEAEAQVSGGTGSYSYSWVNALSQEVSTDQKMVGGSAGGYTVTVADAHACAATGSVTLNPSTGSVINIVDLIAATCSTSGDGGARVEVVSGPGPHIVTWSNGEHTPAATALSAGANSVKVTDGNQCEVTRPFTISKDGEITLSSEIITQPVCPGGATGSIQVLAIGGGGQYSYEWNGTAGSNQLQNIRSGDYALEVSDQKGCRLTQSLTVPVLAAIEIAISELVKPTCFDGGDGKIGVLVSGGNGDYSYGWTGSNSQGTEVTNLSAGSYTVTAIDKNGCRESKEFTVDNPEKFVIDVGGDQVVCPGQSLRYSPEVIGVVYEWSGPNGFSHRGHELVASGVGEYELKVTDAKGCQAEDRFKLSESTQLLKADLLAVSEAHALDTIMVIDISWPVPETVRWAFGSEATILESSKDYALISYREPGEYTVGVNAALGGCESSFTQGLRILRAREESEGGRKGEEKTSLIVDYSIHPNPFREGFEINVSLGQPSALSIQIVRVASNQTVLDDELAENTHHQKQYATSHLLAGVYVLIVRAGDEIKSIRLLKL
jgi:hypothetical protein